MFFIGVFFHEHMSMHFVYLDVGSAGKNRLRSVGYNPYIPHLYVGDRNHLPTIDPDFLGQPRS